MNKFKRPVPKAEEAENLFEKPENQNEISQNEPFVLDDGQIELLIQKPEKQTVASVLETVMEEKKTEPTDPAKTENIVPEILKQEAEFIKKEMVFDKSLTELSLSLIKQHAFMSTGMAWIPMPFADLAGVNLVQMWMLKRLADLYGIPFRQDALKSVIGVFVYDLGTSGAVRWGMSLLKSVPFFGAYAGAISLSMYSAAFTYALGQVFRQHFEAGGSFLDFNPYKVRAYFRDQYEEGKNFPQKP